MASLTERENLLMVYNGDIPEWVPISEYANQTLFAPSYFGEWNRYDGKKAGDVIYDSFGVMHTVSDPRIGSMPVEGVYKITDITKWSDQFPVKDWPDLTKIDWKYYAEKDTAGWDRKNKLCTTAFGGSSSGTTFMWGVTLMGFEKALEYMLTEPEAWDDLLNELTAWLELQIRYISDYYDPDCMSLADDCSFNKGLFMSPALYRARIKPFHARLVKTVKNCGRIPTIHCCGKADAIVGDFIEIGLRQWNPAQVWNDIEGIKERYGNTIVLNGCWDSNGPAGVAGASEETVRAAVRSAIDRGGPGGGYMFSTSGMTLEWDVGTEHYHWIYDEAVKYGADYYKKNR